MSQKELCFTVKLPQKNDKTKCIQRKYAKRLSAKKEARSF